MSKHGLSTSLQTTKPAAHPVINADPVILTLQINTLISEIYFLSCFGFPFFSKLRFLLSVLPLSTVELLEFPSKSIPQLLFQVLLHGIALSQ